MDGRGGTGSGRLGQCRGGHTRAHSRNGAARSPLARRASERVQPVASIMRKSRCWTTPASVTAWSLLNHLTRRDLDGLALVGASSTANTRASLSRSFMWRLQSFQSASLGAKHPTIQSSSDPSIVPCRAVIATPGGRIFSMTLSSTMPDGVNADTCRLDPTSESDSPAVSYRDMTCCWRLFHMGLCSKGEHVLYCLRLSVVGKRTFAVAETRARRLSCACVSSAADRASTPPRHETARLRPAVPSRR